MRNSNGTACSYFVIGNKPEIVFVAIKIQFYRCIVDELFCHAYLVYRRDYFNGMIFLQSGGLEKTLEFINVQFS